MYDLLNTLFILCMSCMSITHFYVNDSYVKNALLGYFFIDGYLHRNNTDIFIHHCLFAFLTNYIQPREFFYKYLLFEIIIIQDKLNQLIYYHIYYSYWIKHCLSFLQHRNIINISLNCIFVLILPLGWWLITGSVRPFCVLESTRYWSGPITYSIPCTGS